MPTKNRQQLLLVVTVAVLALLALDRLLLPPVTRLWKDRSARIADLRTKVREGRMLLAREDAIRGRWSQMQTNMLPNDASVAEQNVFLGFNRWANGVQVNSIIPQWKQDSEEFKTIECRVDATGTLDAVSRFLHRLEIDPMALKVQSVELTARDNEGQLLTVGLQVSGLALIPKEQRRP